MTTSSSTTSSRSLTAMLDLVEIKPGVTFSRATLQDLLPDAETALFFAKVYDLDYKQVSNLLCVCLSSTLAHALFEEGGMHSDELQGYIVELMDMAGIVDDGEVTFDPDVPHGEILPQVWESLEVEVAKAIKDVAAKLESVVGLLPGKQGSMVMSTMMKLNAKRPTFGDYRAQIQHAPEKQNLVILDVSGSMSSDTVKTIVDDVVALSYKANAHMAIVSDQCTYWAPGSYSVDDVLAAATYGGTHYEELAPLFDRDWGTVITVADYDSSRSAKQHLAGCTGRIDSVLDISLVHRPTFLAECLGQLAGEVRPLLVSNSYYPLA
jgi:hypothetical protein